MKPEASLMDGIKIVGGKQVIEGVQVIPLRRIPDERGTVWHMLKCTDPHFIQFGEIYFSTVYPGMIKGWHKHREMQLRPLEDFVEDRSKLGRQMPPGKWV